MEKLPNGFRHPTTFTVNKATIDDKPWSKSNSLKLLEIKLFNKLLNRTELIERNLIINSLMTLSIYTIRANAIKWFNLDKPQKLMLRQKLIKQGQVYYDYSLQYLQLILSSLSDTSRSKTKLNFNVELSVLVSELLNKVSIYEFNNLNNSMIFSKGLVSIFEELLLNVCDQNLGNSDTLSYDVKMMLMFLNFASKSTSFPKYTHDLLYEYQDMVGELEVYLNQINMKDSSLKFSFNHLKKYTADLIRLFETNEPEAIHEDINILYRMLRKWLCNLPTAVSLIDYLDNPIEFIIMKLYNTLGNILNNIFPQVNLIFLSNFKGHFQLFLDPNYAVRKFPWQGHETTLIKIDYYCNRATTFFLKRYNVLSIFYNYLNFGHKLYRFNYDNILNNDVIRKSINEIKMVRFNETYIRHYHYMHIPNEVTFKQFVPNYHEGSYNDSLNLIKDYKPDYSQLDSLQLFNYNRFHEKYIKGNFIKFIESKKAMGENIWKPQHDDDILEENDPVFNFSLANFGGDLSAISRNQSRSQSGSILASSKNSESPASPKIPHQHDPQLSQVDAQLEPRFNYQLFSNIINQHSFRYILNNDYFNLLICNEKPLITIQMDYDRGLDVHDFDVKDWVNDPNIKFEVMDQQILKHFNIHYFLYQFNKFKNHWLTNDFDLEDENDFLGKFYDDMNDEYFM